LGIPNVANALVALGWDALAALSPVGIRLATPRHYVIEGRVIT
jgi:hypothetical protein